MTDKIVYDVFPIDLQHTARRFFAVLTEDVTLETRVENFDRVYRRGIYDFPTKKARNVFTKVCNDDTGKSVAYRFNRKPEEKENENED